MGESFVSQRQFATHIGRSHVWVSKLVKAGKIPVNDKGRIPLSEGLRAYEASQRVGYDSNREHGAKQRAVSKKKAVTGKPVRAKPVPAASTGESNSPIATLPSDDEPVSQSGRLSIDKVHDAFNRARLAEKTFQAKLKELEYKEAQGLLLKIEEVEEDAAQTAGAIRDQLMSMGPRIAPLCEGKSAREIEAIIEDGINDALAAFQKARFGRQS